MTRSKWQSKEPTMQQRRVLNYVVSYINQHGFPPILEDICIHFGMKSKNGARKHLLALEKKGYIEHGHGKPRTIKVLRKESK